MVVINVPNLRKFRRERLPWTNLGRVNTQDTSSLIPNSEIHTLLKIPKDSSVLFFAGAHGDWANALAKTTQVHYTDLAPEMTAYAKARFPDTKIKKFTTADAVIWPARSGLYDYVVSFEPVPVGDRLYFVGLRALAHTKGIRLVSTSNRLPSFYKKHEKITRTKIKGTDNYAEVASIDSTPELKRHAKIELTLLTLLQRLTSTTVTHLHQQVKTRVPDATLTDVTQTLRRISGYHNSRFNSFNYLTKSVNVNFNA